MDALEEIRHQATIAGWVAEEDGSPIAGAQVTISAAQAFADWLALKALAFGAGWDRLAIRPDRTLTAPDGRFCFLDLPDGAYTVIAALPVQGSRYGTAVAYATVARTADSAVKLAFLNLVLPRTRVSGIVVTRASGAAATDLPVPMAAVRLKGSSESTFTDAKGSYVLSAIEPGQRIVRVEANGLAPAEASITLSGAGQSVISDFALVASSANGAAART